jgi:hypothetical protein
VNHEAAAPPRVLSEEAIRAIGEREYGVALARFPHWVHPFRGLSLGRARRSFGHARPDGTVVVSRIFIGTTALADLRDTLRHEFAHLIVGVAERHGPRWKAVAAALGARAHARGAARDPELQARMNDAPFELVAILCTGEQVPVKPAFRRSRRLLDYRFSRRGLRYQYRGQWVEQFYYRPRGERRSPGM